MRRRRGVAMNSQNQKNTIQMNLTVRLKSFPSEAIYLGVPQMSGCPRMNVHPAPKMPRGEGAFPFSTF